MVGDRKAVARVAFSITMTKTWVDSGAGVSLGAGEGVRDSVRNAGGEGSDVRAVLVGADTHETARAVTSASAARARILNMVASAHRASRLTSRSLPHPQLDDRPGHELGRPSVPNYLKAQASNTTS